MDELFFIVTFTDKADHTNKSVGSSRNSKAIMSGMADGGDCARPWRENSWTVSCIAV